MLEDAAWAIRAFDGADKQGTCNLCVIFINFAGWNLDALPLPIELRIMILNKTI
jgi:hypothetical protein